MFPLLLVNDKLSSLLEQVSQYIILTVVLEAVAASRKTDIWVEKDDCKLLGFHALAKGYKKNALSTGS